jgi:predicted DsbA family dithiol-disulfide isomerase
MYDGLFTKQADINKENFSAKVMEIAQAGGLDTQKLKDCLDGKKAMDALKADESEAAALGVNSTPTFFVNGRRLSGAQTYESFKQTIDSELAGKG